MSGRFGEWSIEEDMFNHLKLYLPERSTILEFGSGWASGELSKIWNLYSVEHDKNFLDKYPTNYIYAPMVGDWYDTIIIKESMPTYDCLIIDGPNSDKRYGMMKHLDMFNLSKPIYMDDLQESYLLNMARELADICGRPLTVIQAVGNPHVDNKKFGVI